MPEYQRLLVVPQQCDVRVADAHCLFGDDSGVGRFVQTCQRRLRWRLEASN